MRERIRNELHIEVDGVDLTTVRNIEFYVRQGKCFFRTYPAFVVSPSEMTVSIPFEDAMQLTSSMASLQFAFVDANGTPRASEPAAEPVGILLKKAGYDP